MEDFYLRSFLLFFSLFNPFLMSIYLLELIRGLPTSTFAYVLLRGSVISGCVFMVFSWQGEAFFRDYLQVRFASFQIFGGIVFLLIGLRYVFQGADAINDLMKGTPETIAGSIAMPIMIGPGTGQRLGGHRHAPALARRGHGHLRHALAYDAAARCHESGTRPRQAQQRGIDGSLY